MDFSLQSLDDGPDSSTDPFYKYLPLYQVRKTSSWTSKNNQRHGSPAVERYILCLELMELESEYYNTSVQYSGTQAFKSTLKTKQLRVMVLD